jgi:hypothetical protein
MRVRPGYANGEHRWNQWSGDARQLAGCCLPKNDATPTALVLDDALPLRPAFPRRAMTRERSGNLGLGVTQNEVQSNRPGNARVPSILTA